MPGAGDIPRTRTARGAAVARFAAEQAVRGAGTRAANLTRSPPAARRALDRRQLEAVDQLVRVLGTMKGAAMKVGQMLSVFDLRVTSAGLTPEIQARLAALRDSAPQVAFAQMREVIERDLRAPLAKLFAELDPEPIAAASIGQVYRARLADGRAVAVKVQYPGVATAVRADLKNLALMMRVLRRYAPGLDVEALAQELRARIGEELDYRQEAANQSDIAARLRGHPFFVVPAVVPERCSERVLVSEYVEGRPFADICREGDAVRDRVGEILFRFYCGCVFRLAQFSGDPHPGNFLLLGDGRVAFLDFGLYKRMDPGQVALEMACERAATEGDAGELHRRFAEAGYLPEPERVDPGRLLDFVHDAAGWYLLDGERELTAQDASDALIASADPRSPYFPTMRHQQMPPEHLLARRAVLYTLGVLGQLRAQANWHRIAREWLYGEAPATELGRAEAGFYAAHGA